MNEDSSLKDSYEWKQDEHVNILIRDSQWTWLGGRERETGDQ